MYTLWEPLAEVLVSLAITPPLSTALIAKEGEELTVAEYEYRLSVFTANVLDDGDLDGDGEWVPFTFRKSLKHRKNCPKRDLNSSAKHPKVIFRRSQFQLHDRAGKNGKYLLPIPLKEEPESQCQHSNPLPTASQQDPLFWTCTQRRSCMTWTTGLL